MKSTRSEKTVWVRGPLKPGTKVIKPLFQPTPKRARWYNPDGEPFERQVPYEWAMLLHKDGIVEIIQEPKAKPAKAGGKDK